jgi:hypothetical protein
VTVDRLDELVWLAKTATSHTNRRKYIDQLSARFRGAQRSQHRLPERAQLLTRERSITARVRPPLEANDSDANSPLGPQLAYGGDIRPIAA